MSRARIPSLFFFSFVLYWIFYGSRVKITVAIYYHFILLPKYITHFISCLPLSLVFYLHSILYPVIIAKSIQYTTVMSTPLCNSSDQIIRRGKFTYSSPASRMLVALNRDTRCLFSPHSYSHDQTTCLSPSSTSDIVEIQVLEGHVYLETFLCVLRLISL